jgi:hypothetical protein
MLSEAEREHDAWIEWCREMELEAQQEGCTAVFYLGGVEFLNENDEVVIAYDFEYIGNRPEMEYY